MIYVLVSLDLPWINIPSKISLVNTFFDVFLATTYAMMTANHNKDVGRGLQGWKTK